MDDKALQQLISLVDAAHATPSTDTPAIILPIGTKVESLETLQARPSRKRDTFSTDRITDFATYCSDHSGDDSVICIAPDDTRATCLFDAGSDAAPSWHDHKAVLRLTQTKAYAAFLDALTKPISQRAMLDWCADWEPNLIFSAADGETLSHGVAIQALQEIKQRIAQDREHTEQDLKRARSTLEEISIRASKTTPTRISFTCEPYTDFDPRTFACRIAYRAGDEITLRLVPVGIEREQDAILEEFRSRLTNAMSSITYRTMLIGTLT